MNKDNWIISRTGFHPDQITGNGNRFLIGNGYMGIRGTVEEFGREQLTAVNLSGIYDQVGDGWREPLNAPNGLFTCLKIDGSDYRLPEVMPQKHEIRLDYRHGVFERESEWKTKRGTVTVVSRRFASAADAHLCCMQYTVKADFHADAELITGIDGDVWDIHGPHYDRMSFSQGQGYAQACGITHEKQEEVWVSEQYRTDFSYEWKGQQAEAAAVSGDDDRSGRHVYHHLCFITEKGKEYVLEKYIGVYTGKDCKEPAKAAQNSVRAAAEKGFAACLAEHKQEWDNFWEMAAVEIEGDREAMKALNYSLYHLRSIAPRHAASLSIPARGLSGQTYKGAVFWDTEMFMLPFFIYTDPKAARTLLKYRIDTLAGARKKAAAYGYQGAFYAWESQEGGYDACTDYNVTDVFTGRPMRTYFKDKQYHISAAVVYGLMNYYETTGDVSILEEGGMEVILACAEFYYSLLMRKAAGNSYEILDAIGPDEYHERVNNNGYTNRAAQYTFETALHLLKQLNTFSGESRKNIKQQYAVEQLKEKYEDAAAHIYLPQPDANGIVEQFDGYLDLEDVSVDEVRSRLLHEKEYWGGAYGVASHTQVIKQADVITWMALFPADFTTDIKRKNYEYYEPRTEHGSSLSACMYALLACECGMPEQAYPFFMKSATADLRDGGKEWAGLVYIGGTHPAAAGGAYMNAVMGFAGLKIIDGKPVVQPRLPQSFKRMRFRIQVQGIFYEITIDQNKGDIRPLVS